MNQKTDDTLLPLAQRRQETAYGDINCHLLRVNPKALDESLLFGKMDPNTMEWLDGIVAAVCLTCFIDF